MKILNWHMFKIFLSLLWSSKHEFYIRLFGVKKEHASYAANEFLLIQKTSYSSIFPSQPQWEPSEFIHTGLDYLIAKMKLLLKVKDLSLRI